jgi:hypothetical protein
VTATPSSTTAAATAVIIATSTAAAKAALVTGARFVYAERAPFDLLPIELAYGVLRVGFRSHRHEGESAGLAREFILHEQHFGHGASLRKHVLQLEFRRRERQVAYVQSISHNGLDYRFRSLPVPSPELRR